MPIIRPTVETPVGRVPSFLTFETAPKITPSSEGRTVQHETRPIIEHIKDAIANPSDVFWLAARVGSTGAY